MQFKVTVEEDGVLHEVFDLNGFVGEIGSRITYSLEPDVPGSDFALVDFADLVGGGSEADVREGCSGWWNSGVGGGGNAVGDDRERRWSHAERPRWRQVELMKFF